MLRQGGVPLDTRTGAHLFKQLLHFGAVFALELQFLLLQLALELCLLCAGTTRQHEQGEWGEKENNNNEG